MVRLHPDDKVVYELRPGVKGRFLEQEVVINSLAMRDVERSYTKPQGAFRIVALGDSHTFGWGVTRDEAWPAVLEGLLHERIPGRSFEVWNLGVPGYNTVQEVRSIELRLAQLQPDVVIINYVSNDMDLPNFLATPPELMTIRKSFLLDLLRRRLAVFENRDLLPEGLGGVVPDSKTLRYRPPQGDIPERYRPLSGWENMENAYKHLVGLAEELGFTAVLLFNPDDYRPRLEGWSGDVRLRPVRRLGERLQKAGYLIVDVQDRAFAYLASNGLDNRALWIRSNDSHTNPVRHRLVAEELVHRLDKAGLLPVSSPDRL
jgi:hypothetical protein